MIEDEDKVVIKEIETELGKKTIVHMPIRYAYFFPQYLRLRSEGEALELAKAEFKQRAKKKRKLKSANEDNCIDYNSWQFIESRLSYEFDHCNENELDPILVDLKTGKTIPHEISRKRLNGIRETCPIYNNSKVNPARLYLDKKLRSANHITYISVLEYNDTGNAVFTFLKSNACWVRTTGAVFYLKPSMYQLTIRKQAATTLTHNGRLCTSTIKIGEVLQEIIEKFTTYGNEHHHGYQLIKSLFIKHFFSGKLPSDMNIDSPNMELMSGLYRVKRNIKLRELPWEESELANIYSYRNTSTTYNRNNYKDERSTTNARKSLNRYLRLGNTKKAVDACFYGFTYPKSIRRVLLKTKPLAFDFKNYRDLYLATEKHGVDKVRNLISSKDGIPKEYVIRDSCYLAMLDLGFNVNEIGRHTSRYMQDIIDMKDRLDNRNPNAQIFIPPIVFMSNMQRYHDQLVNAIILIEHVSSGKVRALNSFFDRTAASLKRENFTSLDYCFRSPKVISELAEVGNRLSICVSIYNKAYYLEELEIVLVTRLHNDGLEDYVGCIEVIGNKVVQAKLRFNRQLRTHTALLKATESWCKHEGLTVATNDIRDKTFSTVERLPPNELNLKRLKDVIKKFQTV